MPDFLFYIIVAAVGVNVARFLHKKGLTKVAAVLSVAVMLLSGWMAVQYLFMAIAVRSLIAAVIGAAFCWPAYENWRFLRGLGLWKGIVDRIRRQVGRR